MRLWESERREKDDRITQLQKQNRNLTEEVEDSERRHQQLLVGGCWKNALFFPVIIHSLCLCACVVFFSDVCFPVCTCPLQKTKRELEDRIEEESRSSKSVTTERATLQQEAEAARKEATESKEALARMEQELEEARQQAANKARQLEASVCLFVCLFFLLILSGGASSHVLGPLAGGPGAAGELVAVHRDADQAPARGAGCRSAKGARGQEKVRGERGCFARVLGHLATLVALLIC